MLISGVAVAVAVAGVVHSCNGITIAGIACTVVGTIVTTRRRLQFLIIGI